MPRVIVAVGPTATDPLALAAAARLAQASGSALTALFVEDTNLLRLAELPFAFEISAASGMSRRFAASDLESEFKRQADELRRTLSDVAGTLRLELTFEIGRGRPLSVLLGASGQNDLVVLANAAVRTLVHASAPRIVRDALRAPLRAARPRKPQPVAAVLHSAASAPRVLAAAGRLARATATELVVLLAEHGVANDELAAVAVAWTASHGADARIEPLPDPTPGNIARIIATRGVHAVFWPGDGGPDSIAEVEMLLDAIGCPLILVR